MPAVYCCIRNLSTNIRANQTFFNTTRSWALPQKDLLNKAKISDLVRKELYSTEHSTIRLIESTDLVLNKPKTCNFYKLLNAKTRTGPKRWNENLSMNEDSWEKVFASLSNLCKETEQKEFQFKLIHHIIGSISTVLSMSGLPSPRRTAVCMSGKACLWRKFIIKILAALLAVRNVSWWQSLAHMTPTARNICTCAVFSTNSFNLGLPTYFVSHYCYGRELNAVSYRWVFFKKVEQSCLTVV